MRGSATDGHQILCGHEDYQGGRRERLYLFDDFHAPDDVTGNRFPKDDSEYWDYLGRDQGSSRVRGLLIALRTWSISSATR